MGPAGRRPYPPPLRGRAPPLAAFGAKARANNRGLAGMGFLKLYNNYVKKENTEISKCIVFCLLGKWCWILLFYLS